MSERDKLRGIVIIPSPSEEYLNDRQRVAYRSHREDIINWLASRGKDPENLEGYAKDTYYVFCNVLDQFHRHVWEQDGYTLSPSMEQGKAFLKDRIDSPKDYSGTHLNNVQDALIAYFEFRGGEFERDITIPDQSSDAKPKDFLTLDERDALREAVLEYDTIPHYAGLEPGERREWKRYLARRFQKPVDDVSREDWDRINGFKYPSMVYTGLDAGLRPVEMGRARASWVDTENMLLRIPAKESSKNENNWHVPLMQETTEFLARWLEQRELYEKYDDTDRLWLTRHGNPYKSKSLLVLLDNLREIAGIERHFSWYAIRHSTGTYMAREEGLAAAQAQLRHESKETTMKYDQAPPEDRRDGLGNM